MCDLKLQIVVLTFVFGEIKWAVSSKNNPYFIQHVLKHHYNEEKKCDVKT